MNLHQRLVVWLGCLLLWLLGPRIAEAAEPDTVDIDCARARALLELEPSERESLQLICARQRALTGETARTIEALLRHGGWRSHLGIELLSIERDTSEAPEDAKQSPKTSAKQSTKPDAKQSPEDRVEELLNKVFQEDRCSVQQRDFRAYVHATRRHHHRRPDEKDVEPVPWLVDVPKQCLTKEDAKFLQDFLADHSMFAAIGVSAKELEINAIDGAQFDMPFDSEPPPVRREVAAHDFSVPKWGGAEQIAIAWLRKSEYAVIKVDQHDLDVDWFVTRMMRDDDVIEPIDGGCLIVEVGSENPDLSWYAVVDGTPLALTATSTKTRRGTFRVPHATTDLVYLAHSEGDDPWPWASEAKIGPADPGQLCRQVRSDLRGVAQPQQLRYGITQVAVDERCRDNGITEARILRYLERYLSNAGVNFELLETWADALADFRKLDQDFDDSETVGATRRELDIGTSLYTAAAEMRRQGVNMLLDLEVHCAGAGAEPSVTGRTVDVGEFSRRDRSRLVGVDTAGLIEVHTQTKPAVEVRAALDVVLGHLLKRSQSRLNTISSTIQSGTSETLTAVAEVRGAQDVEHRMELRVLRLSAHQGIATCELVERGNSLVSLTGFEELEQQLGHWGELWVANESIFGSGCETDAFARVADSRHSDGANPSICRSSPLEQGTVSVSVDLGGLRRGKYIAYTWIVGDESSADDFVATCFEVQERDLSVFTSVGGIATNRGSFSKDQKLKLDELREERVVYFQALVGSRYTVSSFFDAGFELGYAYSAYRADDWPAWDDLNIAAQPTSSDQLRWDRHGFLVGAFAGARLPFSPCYYRSRRTCRENIAHFSVFVDTHLRANFGGITNVRIGDQSIGLPGGEQAINTDFDLAVLTGLSYRPNNGVQISAWLGTLVSDIGQGIRAISQPEVSSRLTYDYNVTGMLGFEAAWTITTGSRIRK